MKMRLPKKHPEANAIRVKELSMVDSAQPPFSQPGDNDRRLSVGRPWPYCPINVFTADPPNGTKAAMDFNYGNRNTSLSRSICDMSSEAKLPCIMRTAAAKRSSVQTAGHGLRGTW
ncbi:hypothetical protein GCM10027396_39780 [Insolitispirillum peregrinum]